MITISSMSFLQYENTLISKEYKIAFNRFCVIAFLSIILDSQITKKCNITEKL